MAACRLGRGKPAARSLTDELDQSHEILILVCRVEVVRDGTLLELRYGLV